MIQGPGLGEKWGVWSMLLTTRMSAGPQDRTEWLCTAAIDQERATGLEDSASVAVTPSPSTLVPNAAIALPTLLVQFLLELNDVGMQEVLTCLYGSSQSEMYKNLGQLCF